MVDSVWTAVAAGCVLGFLSGLGVGGGSLLLLWLTQAAQLDRSQARLINLMFFIPCALAASWLRRRSLGKQRAVTLPAIAGGIIGAVLGTWLGGVLDPAVLRRGFGVLLLVCGIRELLWKPALSGG